VIGEPRPSVVTIGNFDGVHAGHRQIMRRVARIANENGWTPTVLTFDPHPTRLIAPDRAPRLLTSPEQRVDFMRAEGIERVEVLPFTREVANLTPEEFVSSILIDKLHARAILVGENFRFGHRAAGNIETLRELGPKYGFRTETVAPVLRRHRMVSSSEVRRLIELGNVSAACRMLERPYELAGRVVAGHGIGSRQTVPTLNLDTSAEVLPAIGVYITRTFDVDTPRVWDSITNIGHRPTFGGTGLTIETFLLSPFSGETPSLIRVQFLHRVRDERKFDTPDDLKRQIMKDVGRAQSFFRRNERFRFAAGGTKKGCET
jgi:riboflavin kinase/FMN adenylyltransferase